VPKALVSGIETGLTVQGGGTLKNAQAVKSEDFENVYFISAEIDGPEWREAAKSAPGRATA